MLNWVSMVQSLYEGYGESGSSYQNFTEQILTKGRPNEIYKLYERYVATLKAERNRVK